MLRLVLLAAACLVAIASSAGPVRATNQDRWASLTTAVFRSYGQDEGLPNPVTTAVAESGDGFLWVGTEGGLARWDGYHFRTYLPVAGDAGTLPDSWITTLHSDPQGRLWVGTSAGGLARYDSGKDRFVTYGAGRGGLSNVHVWAMADDGANGLWIASEGGLDHLDTQTGRISSLHHAPGDSESLPNNQVLALLHDRRGTLWIGTRGGLVRRRATDRFQAVPLGHESPGSTAVCSLLEDDEGRIWIGTTHHGAFVLGPDDAAPHRVSETIPPTSQLTGSSLAREWVYSMTQAGPHEIWLGTYGQGIVVIDTRNGRTHRIKHDLLLRQSLADDTVWALHRDRAGAVWAGTNVGLCRFDSVATGAALTVFGATSNADGLTEGDVVSLDTDRNGYVWAGLRTKGIDVLDPLHGRAFNVAPQPDKPDAALPASMVLSFAQRPNGNMYIGDNFGLYLHQGDRSGRIGRVSRLRVRGRDPAARTAGVLESGGRLWVAGIDDGIWSMSPTTGGVAAVEHFDSRRLTDRRGTMFANGSAGELWIGTRNGLNRLDLRTRKVERIYPNAADATALPAAYVATLQLDRTGRLWVGTYGGGIAVLTGRAGGHLVFRRLTTKQGLPDNNIDSLLLDKTGRIWAATDNGIAVIDSRTFQTRTLHRADGVVISAYWIASRAETKAGELLFGGAGGLTVIRPERYHQWDYRAPVVVTQALVGGKVVPASRFDSGNSRTTDAAPLLVKPDANSVAVEFSALDYSAPDRNRYAYRLDGYDRDWIDTDATRRVAAYTNLPPGNYTLHLRGSNREGMWTENALAVPIRVLPAWYQTLLFRIVAGLASVLAIFALVQGRTRYLRRRERDLEHQVALRTFELEESKRQVEQFAYHDTLTGLPNRRQFNDDLRKLVAVTQRQRAPLALLLIDLDRFKAINDTLGHDAGDALLVEAARRMRASLRISDRLARLGGDEFAVLIDDLSGPYSSGRETIEVICKRLVECLADPILFGGAEILTSASVGIALYRGGAGSGAESLFKESDLALYEAKHSGRNTWRWHMPTAGEKTQMEPA